MHTDYVSEFTVFINQYLDEHPKVVEEQRRGWSLFWTPKIAREALDDAQEERVPDDSYGFSWSAWRAEATHVKTPEKPNTV